MSAIAKERRALGTTLDELDRKGEKLAAERAAIDAEIAAVEAERGKVAFALEVLDRLDDTGDVQKHAPRAPSGRRVPGGSADYAIRALKDIGAPSTAEEVVERMTSLGWDAGAVTRPVEVARNALIRAMETGEVRKAGYGKYEPVEAGEPDESAATISAPTVEVLARPDVDS